MIDPPPVTPPRAASTEQIYRSYLLKYCGVGPGPVADQLWREERQRLAEIQARAKQEADARG